MAHISLSRRDINVLEKIKDPESNPEAGVRVDASLPKDRYFPDQTLYERVAQREKDVVLSMQQLELQLAGLRPKTSADIVGEYQSCVAKLGALITEYPNYASARNNRAQALRRLYGDNMLVEASQPLPQAIVRNAEAEERERMASMALGDLDRAITLLTPPVPYMPLSPQAAKTLSLAHTQRAAIYHMTSKLLASSILSVDSQRREASWTSLGFEEAASADFAMGGRYGNEIAKGLAVSTNPTAKLCGQMVREAMKKEYGPDFAV